MSVLAAIEGLVQWVAAHHQQVRSLVVRPPKLLIDQTNTTLGRQGAMAVEQVAAAVVTRLCIPDPSKAVQVLESFQADNLLNPVNRLNSETRLETTAPKA